MMIKIRNSKWLFGTGLCTYVLMWWISLYFCTKSDIARSWPSAVQWLPRTCLIPQVFLRRWSNRQSGCSDTSFGMSNWWIQWLWPSWNLAAILSFQDEEREKKEKEAEERRAKEAQKEAEERAKEAHQALLKHFTIHTVLQSWCHLRHTCYLLSNHQTDLSLV